MVRVSWPWIGSLTSTTISVCSSAVTISSSFSGFVTSILYPFRLDILVYRTGYLRKLVFI